jgi:hypothetical protein
MNLLLKNFLSLAVIVAVVAAGFWYVVRTPVSTGLEHIEIAPEVSSVRVNPADEFAALLKNLSGVDFQRNKPVFNDEVFRSGLVSFRRDLPVIDRSRANPFAPLEGAAGSYVHYSAPLPASLTPASTTTAFPAATTTRATTSRRQ